MRKNSSPVLGIEELETRELLSASSGFDETLRVLQQSQLTQLHSLIAPYISNPVAETQATNILPAQADLIQDGIEKYVELCMSQLELAEADLAESQAALAQSLQSIQTLGSRIALLEGNYSQELTKLSTLTTQYEKALAQSSTTVSSPEIAPISSNVKLRSQGEFLLIDYAGIPSGWQFVITGRGVTDLGNNITYAWVDASQGTVAIQIPNGGSTATDLQLWNPVTKQRANLRLPFTVDQRRVTDLAADSGATVNEFSYTPTILNPQQLGLGWIRAQQQRATELNAREGLLTPSINLSTSENRVTVQYANMPTGFAVDLTAQSLGSSMFLQRSELAAGTGEVRMRKIYGTTEVQIFLTDLATGERRSMGQMTIDGGDVTQQPTMPQAAFSDLAYIPNLPAAPTVTKQMVDAQAVTTTAAKTELDGARQQLSALQTMHPLQQQYVQANTTEVTLRQQETADAVLLAIESLQLDQDMVAAATGIAPTQTVEQLPVASNVKLRSQGNFLLIDYKGVPAGWQFVITGRGVTDLGSNITYAWVDASEGTVAIQLPTNGGALADLQLWNPATKQRANLRLPFAFESSKITDLVANSGGTLNEFSYIPTIRNPQQFGLGWIRAQQQRATELNVREGLVTPSLSLTTSENRVTVKYANMPKGFAVDLTAQGLSSGMFLQRSEVPAGTGEVRMRKIYGTTTVQIYLTDLATGERRSMGQMTIDGGDVTQQPTMPQAAFSDLAYVPGLPTPAAPVASEAIPPWLHTALTHPGVTQKLNALSPSISVSAPSAPTAAQPTAETYKIQQVTIPALSELVSERIMELSGLGLSVNLRDIAARMRPEIFGVNAADDKAALERIGLAATGGVWTRDSVLASNRAYEARLELMRAISNDVPYAYEIIKGAASAAYGELLYARAGVANPFPGLVEQRLTTHPHLAAAQGLGVIPNAAIIRSAVTARFDAIYAMTKQVAADEVQELERLRNLEKLVQPTAPTTQEEIAQLPSRRLQTLQRRIDTALSTSPDSRIAMIRSLQTTQSAVAEKIEQVFWQTYAVNATPTAGVAVEGIVHSISTAPQATDTLQTRQQIFQEVFHWYDPNKSLPQGVDARHDSAAGRIFLGLVQKLWTATSPEMRTSIAQKVCEVTNIPVEKIIAAYSTNAAAFAQNITALFRTAQYGHIFENERLGTEPAFLSAQTDLPEYHGGDIRIRFDLDMAGKELAHVRAMVNGHLTVIGGAHTGLFVKIPVTKLMPTIGDEKYQIRLFATFTDGTFAQTITNGFTVDWRDILALKEVDGTPVPIAAENLGGLPGNQAIINYIAQNFREEFKLEKVSEDLWKGLLHGTGIMQCKEWLQRIVIKEATGVRLPTNADAETGRWIETNTEGVDTLADAGIQVIARIEEAGEFQEALANARAGDVIQMYGTFGQHTAVITQIDADGVWVMDTNFGEEDEGWRVAPEGISATHMLDPADPNNYINQQEALARNIVFVATHYYQQDNTIRLHKMSYEKFDSIINEGTIYRIIEDAN